MSRLYLSLIAAILVALAVISQLFSWWQFNDQSVLVDPAFDQWTQHLREQLIQSAADQRNDVIIAAGNTSPWAPRLIASADMQFPASLEAMINGSGLIITDTAQPSIIMSIDQNTNLAVDLPDQSHQQNTAWRVSMLLYTSLTLILLLWLSPLMLRLSQLNKVAKEVNASNLNARLKPASWSYIFNIEQSFDHMLNRLQGLIEEQRLLASSLSHDLKTPLAGMRFGLDALPIDCPEAEHTADRLLHEVDRMESMTQTYLNYARMNRLQQPLSIEEINIEEICLAVWSSVNLAKGNDQAELKLETNQTSLILRADPHWLERCFSNLFSNSLQYGANQVLVKHRREGKHQIIEVHDNGSGIALDQRDLVFQAFYRGQSANSQGKNYGLGLAIVRRIIQWHRGDIQLIDSQFGRGCAFLLRLPN